MVLLKNLIEGMDGVTLAGDAGVDVSSITCDSRKACAGALFAALPGVKTDGAEYARDAVAAGAVAVLAGSEIDSLGVPVMVAENPRKAFALIASAFYGAPSKKLKLIGITGTNGKTTVAYGLRHVIRKLGHRVGMLGTIEYDNGREAIAAPLTTPQCDEFSRILSEMVEAGASYAIAEVSSHSLSQDRVVGHEFACGIFTNLTRDHLDYHGDMKNYMEAKRILFTSLPEGACAVVNGEDPAADEMLRGIAASPVSYGFEKTDDVRGEIMKSGLGGSEVMISKGAWSGTLRTPLVGRYNMENCLAIIAGALSVGLDGEAVLEALRDFTGAPGRLQRFSSEDGVTVFVDYAHTDDALRSVLGVLRPLVDGRLITVFGCGGDRDAGKRPLMAKAAEEFSDNIIVTSDNPRTEDPASIINQICEGLSGRTIAEVVPDRREAIEKAVASAVPGDAVLVAGKGHEDYQIIGTKKIHLDDREIVERALKLFGAAVNTSEDKTP
ncbi:MAG: UDP-N-acetylmuramoyl-L-alanyl-D-glutamate--2,6-diaminopimelate ligase [Planctomycetes bacterium]|nr:UDP-N-acetylmuramoyl-L-alanyl-D-glutamate--2,6-diaminopimelate ligase [Planctomycetota bacterium]